MMVEDYRSVEEERGDRAGGDEGESNNSDSVDVEDVEQGGGDGPGPGKRRRRAGNLGRWVEDQ